MKLFSRLLSISLAVTLFLVLGASDSFAQAHYKNILRTVKDTWQNGAWAQGQNGYWSESTGDLSDYSLPIVKFVSPVKGYLYSFTTSVVVERGYEWIGGRTNEIMIAKNDLQFFNHPLQPDARWQDLWPSNLDYMNVVESINGGAHERHNVSYYLRDKNFLVEAGQPYFITLSTRNIGTNKGNMYLSFANENYVPQNTPLDARAYHVNGVHVTGYFHDGAFPSDWLAGKVVIAQVPILAPPQER